MTQQVIQIINFVILSIDCLVHSAKEGAYSVGVVNAAYYLFDTYIYEIAYNKNVNEFLGLLGADVAYDLGDFGIKTIWYQKDKDIFSATGFDEDDELGAFSNPDNRLVTQFSWEKGKYFSYLDLFYRGGGKLNDDWDDKASPERYLDIKVIHLVMMLMVTILDHLA